MNGWTWQACCEEACNHLNRVGIVQATYHGSVALWNIEFRMLKNFAHPNPRAQGGKRAMPLLFEKFPEAKDAIERFAVKKLATLTIEAVHDFVHTELVPKLFEIWRTDERLVNQWESDEEFITPEMFLKEHGLVSVSMTTVWRWMHDLGFSYDTRRKSFYVDGHEREDVVAYRVKFCTKYLTEYEPRCHRSVQLPKREAQAIEDVDIDYGYDYVEPATNANYVEFHVDYRCALDFDRGFVNGELKRSKEP